MGNANGRTGDLSGIDSSTALESGDVPSSSTAMGRVPLCFHSVHGDNVRLSSSGRQAKRVESFCKGLAFSNRAVAVDEIVCIKFSEISNNWSGVLRFGLTNTNPASLTGNLPRFVCPDLASKEGNWAKALAEKYCQQGAILHFYVRENGELYYGINGVQKGLFLSGINTRSPLFVMVDIYGNSTALEFLDPSEVPPLRRHMGRSVGVGVASGESSSTAAAADRLAQDLSARTTLPQSSRYHTGVRFRPLSFHATTGANVQLSSSKSIASRADTEYSNGFVFTQRPIRVGEKVVIQILNTLPAYEGGLALGLTACDPVHLRPASFPGDSDLLLDRPEYWVVAKDVASKPRKGDELAFYIGESGQMFFYKNNSAPRVIMHVDHTQALWMFFDVYGNTQRVQLLGVTDVATREAPNRRTQSDASQNRPQPSEAEQNLINFESPPTPSPHAASPAHTASAAQLRVALPPPEPASTPPPPRPPFPKRWRPPRPSAVPSPYVRPPINSRGQAPPAPPPRPPSAKPRATLPAAAPPPSTSGGGGDVGMGDECSVCMVSPVDCVLYTCGHMCMCFECAKEVRSKSGECPICRQMIFDVIKAFKS